MAKTVVGMFKSTEEAERVKERLVAEGFEARNITVMSQNQYSEGTIHTGFDQGYGITGESATGSSMGTKTAGTATSTSGTGSYGSGTASGTNQGYGSNRNEGMGEKIGNFFKSLVGENDDPDRGHQHYQQGITQGGAVLAATVHEDDADEVAQMLRQHGARNVDEEYASGTGAPGSTATQTTKPTSTGQSYGGGQYEGGTSDVEGERSIPVVEEELQVGKRTVNRGGVRIYTHVTERPVSEDVTLREEHVRVERRPVNRAATAADFQQDGKTIELTETSEEAVVGKTSRVVEEVVIGKEATERTESIKDSVRRTDVEVEKIEGQDRFATKDR